MLYTVARFLQIVGLLILPVAITGNVAERLDLKTSLMLSAGGMLIFFIGWLLQQSARPR